MRVNRTLLYAGIFLVAIGGVVVAADLGVVSDGLLGGALGLWPVAIIALGLGLVLRRTRVSLPGGMLAVAVPGLLLGSGFAVVPRIDGFCGAGGDLGPLATEHGEFSSPASVSVTTACGSLEVGTGPGNAWTFEARASGERGVPVIDASRASLAIESSNDNDDWLHAGRDDWTLTLPTDVPMGLDLTVNAGRAEVGLAGADLEGLTVTANAADVVIDASTASIGRLGGEVSFGRLSILLPDGDLVGSLEANAGALLICAPPELGLRVSASESLGEVSVEGRHLGRANYESANYDSAIHRADLSVDVSFGTIEINPIGGCR